MRYLLDTGILLRLPQRDDPLHRAICQAIRILSAEGHTFATSTQNIAEFWNVSTRPVSARGGFGLSIEQARTRLQSFERLIAVLKEPPSAYAKWKDLVTSLAVTGRQV